MVSPGDWVRFYRNGVLVLGVVQYVKERRLGSYSREVCTDIGSVEDTDVLEARAPSPSLPGEAHDG